MLEDIIDENTTNDKDKLSEGPEINIKQGSTDISHSTGIYDFGDIDMGSTSSVIVFTIENKGNKDLTIDSIEKTGTHSSQFLITQSVSSIITSGSSTTFTITFNPSSIGDKTAIIYVVNNDSNKKKYIFSIIGTGDNIIDATLLSTFEISGPKRSNDVYISGNYAYVADTFYGFQIIDISTPSNPLQIYYTNDYEISKIFAANNYLYFIETPLFGDSSFRIIDISSPSNPLEIGSFDFAGTANDFVLSGNYIYSFGLNWFKIIDISTPSNPVEVSSINPFHMSWGIDLTGDYAVVASANSGLKIVNISDVQNPTIDASCDLDYAIDVVISGNYAYVLESTGISVVDISDILNPSVVCATYGTFNGEDIYIENDYAYIAAEDEGLRILDISTPSSPNEVSFFQTPVGASIGALGVHVSNNFAFVANDKAGLRIIDVSNTLSPELEGYIQEWTPRDIKISGNYAYTTAGHAGLRVIDLSTPSNPQQIGVFNSPDYLYRLKLHNDHAYATSRSILKVINISTPSDPYEVQDLDASDWIYGMDATGDYLYICVNNSSNGVKIIDISNPSNPSEVGQISCSKGKDVFIDGNRLYIIYSGRHLKIYDITTPTNPINISGTGYEAFYDCDRFYISGDYAYLPLGMYGLRVIDVSSPLDMSEVGIYDEVGFVEDVKVKNNTAYLAVNQSGLEIVDISTPSNIVEIGENKDCTYAEFIDFYGDYPCIIEKNTNFEYLLHIIEIQ